ncbi:MAG: ABC transporter permease [Bacteroidales bacterium]
MRRISIITTIAGKESISIWSDKFSLLILLIMPAVIVVLFGYALHFDLNQIPFVVLDEDNTPLSQEMVEHIDISPGFHFQGYLRHSGEILQSLTVEGQKVAIAIPKDFSRTTPGSRPEIDLFIDGMDPVMATAIEHNMKSILLDFSDMQQAKQTPQQPRHLWEQPAQPFPGQTQQTGLYTQDPLLAGPAFVPESKVSFLFNPGLKPEVVPIPGVVMIILILISAIMLSLSINREKEQGTNRLLMLTPAGMGDVIAGKAIPYLVISLMHIFSIWLLSSWLFGIQVSGTHGMFFLLCMVFIFNSMALGLLIAAWVRTEQELLICCWFFLFIPNVFYSGFIFPVSTMSELIRPLAALSPGASFIDAYRGIVFRATGFADNWPGLANLAGQAVVAYGLARVGFKRNYLKKR